MTWVTIPVRVWVNFPDDAGEADVLADEIHYALEDAANRLPGVQDGSASVGDWGPAVYDLYGLKGKGVIGGERA